MPDEIRSVPQPAAPNPLVLVVDDNPVTRYATVRC